MSTAKAESGMDQERSTASTTDAGEGEVVAFKLPPQPTGPMTDDEARLSALHEKHNTAKTAAMARYATEFAAEVTSRVFAIVDAIPYVEHALFGNDEPEGRILPNLLERLSESYAGFSQRAGMIHHLANEMNGGADDDEYDPKYWDLIRLQKARTHQRAVELVSVVFALAFACDQYASARHVWRPEVRELVVDRSWSTPEKTEDVITPLGS